MIERFFLNAVDKTDSRMLVVELESGNSCLMTVYKMEDKQAPAFSDWVPARSEKVICQFLQMKGCEEPLELMRNITRFAREHGVQFEELTPADQLAFLSDQEKQANSNNRPTYCPEEV